MPVLKADAAVNRSLLSFVNNVFKEKHVAVFFRKWV